MRWYERDLRQHSSIVRIAGWIWGSTLVFVWAVVAYWSFAKKDFWNPDVWVALAAVSIVIAALWRVRKR